LIINQSFTVLKNIYI